MEELRFLTPELARDIRARWGTPVYVYDEETLVRNAAEALRFPEAFGLTVRYAMKAAPNATILRVFDKCGLHIDASSGHECHRAMRAGIAAERISLSAQELPDDFDRLHEAGVGINACSLDQLDRFGSRFPGGRVGLRFNPGVGSGATHKTNVGGPTSSFGIWHEWADQALDLAARHRLEVFRIHTHIGSGSDPAVWQHVAELSLGIARRFPSAAALNLGGGYKVARMAYEVCTDLQEIGLPVREAFEAFAEETGRKLRLEIEPGTFLVANACSLLSTVTDIVSTGEEGYEFLKLDTGMTEILRPSLYGSQHPLVVVPAKPGAETEEIGSYIAVGHCCESGDLITCAPERHDQLAPREVTAARIGDLCVIEGAGAYCSAMSAKNYNSFPEAPEVLVREGGRPALIRRRQTLDQIVQNEVAPED